MTGALMRGEKRRPRGESDVKAEAEMGGMWPQAKETLAVTRIWERGLEWMPSQSLHEEAALPTP